MERPKLLNILVGIILLITVLNLYATVNLYVGIRMMVKSFLAMQQQNRPLPPANKLNRPASPPLPTERVKVDISNNAIKGSEKSPVTLVEFSDYQCSFSERFFSQTLPQIEKNYIKTGKVKMAFRNYPLSFHQNAQKTAEAAECAGEQGKFWEFHDTAFKNQKDLEDLTNLKKYAKALGLETKKFNDCLDSGKMAAKVQKDTSEGSKYGVSGTPCFFINGLRLSGAMPFTAFEEVIEKELKKK